MIFGQVAQRPSPHCGRECALGESTADPDEAEDCDYQADGFGDEERAPHAAAAAAAASEPSPAGGGYMSGRQT